VPRTGKWPQRSAHELWRRATLITKAQAHGGPNGSLIQAQPAHQIAYVRIRGTSWRALQLSRKLKQRAYRSLSAGSLSISHSQVTYD